jgi:hypothetical protein
MVTDYSPAPALPSYGYEGHKLRGKKKGKEKIDKELRGEKLISVCKFINKIKICGLGKCAKNISLHYPSTRKICQKKICLRTRLA